MKILMWTEVFREVTSGPLGLEYIKCEDNDGGNINSLKAKTLSYYPSDMQYLIAAQ